MSTIEKISTLQNFGIFDDFRWPPELASFKKFNLIYGWNRSGKTTLSRVFSSCEKKSTYHDEKFKQYPASGKFKISTSNDNKLDSDDISNCSLLIKVFNQDFVRENISFSSSNSCNPIVYVGKENVENNQKLLTLREKRKNLYRDLQKADEHEKDKSKLENNFRISAAQSVTEMLTNKTVRDRFFSYDKSKVKNTIEEHNLLDTSTSKNHVLPEKTSNKFKKLIKSEKKLNQKNLPKYEIDLLYANRTAKSFGEIFLIIQELLSRKVTSNAISRLEKDEILNKWVEKGFSLHKSKQEKEKCLFCQNKLDKDFLETLSNHFNKSYSELLDNISQVKNKLDKLKRAPIDPSNNNLYPDLIDRYDNEVKILNNLISRINEWLDKVMADLDKKSANPLTNIESTLQPEDFTKLYNDHIESLNSIIIDHNRRVENHDSEIKLAKDKLELHLISSAIKEQNYKRIKLDLNAAEREKSSKKKS